MFFLSSLKVCFGHTLAKHSSFAAFSMMFQNIENRTGFYLTFFFINDAAAK
jgi:hypothetical protein